MSIKLIVAGLALSAVTLNGAQATEVDQTDLGGFPAVSAINAKFAAGYTKHDISSLSFTDVSGYFVKGSLAAPLNERFGVQVDVGLLEGDLNSSAIVGADGSLSAKGVGGHAFWRDPSKGLIGIYGQYEHYDLDFTGAPGTVNLETVRFGAEGEYYHDLWTVKGFVGGDYLEVDFTGVGGPQLDNTYFAGKLELGYYLTENALVTAGVDHSFDQTFGTIGVEVLLDNGNISPTGFANASFGDDETSFMAGVRVMFAPESKSLMRRHREDDPGNGVFGGIGSMLQCVAGAFDRRGTSLECDEATSTFVRVIR